jgi:hypothetical protein
MHHKMYVFVQKTFVHIIVCIYIHDLSCGVQVLYRHYWFNRSNIVCHIAVYNIILYVVFCRYGNNNMGPGPGDNYGMYNHPPHGPGPEVRGGGRVLTQIHR